MTALLPTPPQAPPAAPLLPTLHQVLRTRRQTRDTVTLWVDVDTPYAPGQFSMLYVPGIGEAAISISTGDDGRHAYTIRAVGGVTTALCALRRGDQLGIRGPFGTAWPVEEATGHDLVLVAGGLGLAPLRPALEAALAHPDRFRRIILLVGARTPGDLLFRDDLLAWAGREDLEVEVTVDRASGAWPGRVGLVTRFVPGLPVVADTAVALVCGPEVMMRFAARALMERGLHPDRIHVSLERHMRCGVGTCGHCQLGPVLVCRDGAVFPWPTAAPLLEVRQL